MYSISKLFLVFSLSITLTQADSAQTDPFLNNPAFLSTEQSEGNSTDPEFGCPQGFYCPPYAKGVGFLCPPGYYCPPSIAEPIPCPAGTYNPKNESFDLSSCLNCTAGNYCPTNTSYPIPCPEGTYNPKNSSENSIDCIFCPQGAYCSKFYLDSCEEQSLCESQISNLNNTCPPGNFSLNTGNDTYSCVSCPQDLYCPNSNVLACDAPSICDNGAVKPTYCPAGTYNDKEGSANDSDCTICPAGDHCRSGSSYPIQCSPGSYNPNPGASDYLDCIDCPRGYFCPEVPIECITTPCYQPGATEAIPCPIGTYNQLGGASTSDDCLLCPAGFYCSNLATSVPAGCRTGTYSNVLGATSKETCLPCDAGFYCDKYALTKPIVCPMGFYCPAYSTSPVKCPDNTFGLKTGFITADECQDCPFYFIDLTAAASLFLQAELETFNCIGVGCIDEIHEQCYIDA